MIFLILSIACSSSLLIFFKIFQKYKIQAPQAISVNYITAAIVGSLFVNKGYSLNTSDSQWYALATILGCLFAIIFNLSRYTTQKIGMSVTSIAMKLGVVFPVLIGLVFYQESFSLLNYVGLALGLIAIVLLNLRVKHKEMAHRYLFLLPIIVWIGSGVCDSSVQFAHKSFEIAASNGTFSFIAFWSAGAASLLFLIIVKSDWDWKMVAGGILLGIPNYFSIYFLLKCLKSMNDEFNVSSSSVFMINNLAVVVASVLIGIFFFHERLSRLNYLGILIAIIALTLIGR